METEIVIPSEYQMWSTEQKVGWMNDICKEIVKKWFFEDSDLLQEVRNVISDPNHDENYWVGNVTNDGQFRCYYRHKSYAFVGTLKSHENVTHGHNIAAAKRPSDSGHDQGDELFNYVISLFKLVALHKNLDSAVDMGDGNRSVRSAKYETPIYNKTNKTKYLIGSIQLTGLVSGTLPKQQSQRLIANRFVNLTWGKNNNLALDEYIELINGDTKITCSGFQTKESIIKHSKEFPQLIDAVKQFDAICEVRDRKVSHKLPSYKADLRKIAMDLVDIQALTEHPGRQLKCRSIVHSRNPYDNSYTQLATMIYRHKPSIPFRRLRNARV